MALVQLNLRKDGPEGRDALLRAALTMPFRGSVVVMVHCYRFCPDHPSRSPHSHILSLDNQACWKAVSWPRHLRLHRPGAGLGVAVGWQARGSLPRVAARAHDTGVALAAVLSDLHRMRPDLHLNIIGHSLGARVALSALCELPAGSIQRVILMSGAEYRSAAVAAMASPAGRRAQVLNMCSGENALFDGIFRLCVPAPVLSDRPLSAGIPNLPGWIDLRIDCASHRTTLRQLGFRTKAPTTRVCHWSTYLRPGLFKLYRHVMDPTRPEVMTQLAAQLLSSPIPNGPRMPEHPAAFGASPAA